MKWWSLPGKFPELKREKWKAAASRPQHEKRRFTKPVGRLDYNLWCYIWRRWLWRLLSTWTTRPSSSTCSVSSFSDRELHFSLCGHWFFIHFSCRHLKKNDFLFQFLWDPQIFVEFGPVRPAFTCYRWSTSKQIRSVSRPHRIPDLHRYRVFTRQKTIFVIPYENWNTVYAQTYISLLVLLLLLLLQLLVFLLLQLLLALVLLMLLLLLALVLLMLLLLLLVLVCYCY